MKKIFIILLAFMIILLCAACGGNKTDGQTTEPAASPPPESDAPAPDGSGNVYNIADYYKKDGTYSDLGRSLPFDPGNGERILTVVEGDILIIGERQFKVAAETINMPFYTQSSIDEVIAWWTDYMDSRLETGNIIVIK